MAAKVKIEKWTARNTELQLIILLQKTFIGGITLCHVIQVQVGKFLVV